MELEELKDLVKGMYEVGPEVENIRGLIDAVVGAGEKEPNYELMLKACEELVDEGILQPAGREGFEATLDYMEECGHDASEPKR